MSVPWGRVLQTTHEGLAATRRFIEQTLSSGKVGHGTAAHELIMALTCNYGIPTNPLQTSPRPFDTQTPRLVRPMPFLRQIPRRSNPHALPKQPKRNRKQTKNPHNHTKDAKGLREACFGRPFADEKCPGEGDCGAHDGGHDEAVGGDGVVGFDEL